MVVLWAGYTFSKDYSTPRGHMYALNDAIHSLRTGAPMKAADGPQPSSCWACKSPDVPRLMQTIGVDSFYRQKWAALGREIVNPVGCADCHEPENMNLHISRPALIEAFSRQGKDVNKASPQEMRSLVCAQCHAEYYFQGDEKRLTFPWDKGLTVENIEKYYDEADFTDYIHKLSRALILKAQHPDYEIFRMGIHAQRGVSCADCHMPYDEEGGIKYSDHHIQNPLAVVERTCQTCHRDNKETLRHNVYERQQKANGTAQSIGKGINYSAYRSQVCLGQRSYRKRNARSIDIYSPGTMEMGFRGFFSWRFFPCSTRDHADLRAWAGQSIQGTHGYRQSSDTAWIFR